MFRTSVKAFRLQEAEGTILVFNNYSDNQEFSLKQQERINRVTNGTVRVYMVENAQKMLLGKAYQQYLKKTKIKLYKLPDLHNTRSKTTYAQN